MPKQEAHSKMAKAAINSHAVRGWKPQHNTMFLGSPGISTPNMSLICSASFAQPNMQRRDRQIRYSLIINSLWYQTPKSIQRTENCWLSAHKSLHVFRPACLVTEDGTGFWVTMASCGGWGLICWLNVSGRGTLDCIRLSWLRDGCRLTLAENGADGATVNSCWDVAACSVHDWLLNAAGLPLHTHTQTFSTSHAPLTNNIM